MSGPRLDQGPARRSDQGSARRRVRGAVRRSRVRRRWLFASGALAIVALGIVGALAVLHGPASVLPGWVDRALDLPQTADPPTAAAPPDLPDLRAVRSGVVGAGPASVTVRAFDGRQLAKGSVAVTATGCDFDLTGENRRFVQAAGRLYATALAGQPAWVELSAVPAADAGLDRLAQLGLSDVTPYALAADPCRMLAVASAPGVVAESPSEGSFVMTLAGAALPGKDVVSGTARRLLPGTAAELTVEVDVDAGRRPTRIRAFSGGVFDCEAQFTGWGKGVVITAPSSASPPPAAG